ncbi:hypothetical protein A2U01_0086793, partial [Trifolium medium]|nr:hypothetical protein [Trifolium medium]
ATSPYELAFGIRVGLKTAMWTFDPGPRET